MRERRRVILARRQLVLAEIARREAMAALADAVQEEDRGATLAERSRTMLREYGNRVEALSGGALRQHAAFMSSLQGIAKQASEAHRDASDQAQWQLQTLATAETRASRFEERMATAQRALEAAREKREQAVPQAMARKLQRGSDSAGQS